MQKLITVAINLEKLRGTAQGTFTITEVEELNNFLQEGWIIEEYEFLSAGGEDEQEVVLFILNDEMSETEFDITAEDADEDEDSFPEDDEQKEGRDEEVEDEDEDEGRRAHANVPMI